MAPRHDGTFVRERIVRQAGKYPLHHVTETLRPGAGPGMAEQVLEHVESVADHLLITTAIADLANMNLPAGALVRGRLGRSQTWIVAFEVVDFTSRPQMMAALMALPGIQAAESDRVISLTAIPDDPALGLCWGLSNSVNPDADIDAPSAWNLSTGSRAVTVGVIDTGIDYSHPDLAANIWSNPGESGMDGAENDRRSNGIDDDGNGFIDDWHGWDFANADNDPMDDNGHGTHCAGTIGAVGNDGNGIAGVCWQVSLVPVKFLDRNGNGYTSDALTAIDYTRNLGISMTSNSWSGTGSNAALADAIGRYTGAGGLFIAAAGNNLADNDTSPNFPASYPDPGIISVAASDLSDSQAWFTATGATSVDIFAPGVDVYSCIPNGGYQYLSGTSMATPHVAGACALLRAYRPHLSAQEIKSQVLGSATRLPQFSGRCVSGARLDVGRALVTDGLPILVASALSASDDPALGATGNGNGLFEIGETLAISLSLTNQGRTSAHAAEATLRVDDPHGVSTIVRANVPVGDIPQGGSINLGTPLLVTIGSAALPGYAFQGIVDALQTGEGLSQAGRITLTVSALQTISGTVFKRGLVQQTPTAGAVITYTGRSSGSVQTGDDGSYRIEVPDGTYNLSAAAAGMGFSVPVTLSVPPDRVQDFYLGVPDVTIDPDPLNFSIAQGAQARRSLSIANQRSTPITAVVHSPHGQPPLATGLWHRATEASVAGLACWSYALPEGGSYDTGDRTSGELIFRDVAVSPNELSVLRYWSRRSCGGVEGSDVCEASFSIDGGASWTILDNPTSNTGEWEPRFSYFVPWHADRVWIRFRFDSIDASDNRHGGWQIDGLQLGNDETKRVGFLGIPSVPVTIAAGGSADIPIQLDGDDLAAPATLPLPLSVQISEDGSGEYAVMGSIEVQAAPLIEAALSGFLDFNLPSNDGDWIPEAGETLQPFFMLRNRGNASLSSGILTMHFDDPYVRIETATAATPAMPGPSDTQVSYPLALVVTEDCPDERLVSGSLTLTEDGSGREWNFPVSFRVRGTWEMSGKVTRSDNAPVPGALISNGVKSGTSDANGNFTLRGLHPGRQVFRITAPGLGSLRAVRSEADGPWTSAQLSDQMLTLPTEVLSVRVPLGGSTEIDLPLGNAGGAPLTWELSTAVNSYSVLSGTIPTEGPDGWRDISASGLELRELFLSSSSAGPHNLGMAFPFFESARSAVRVSPYGYASFSSSTSSAFPLPLPSQDAVADQIAWLWQIQWYGERGATHVEQIDPDHWVIQEDGKVYWGGERAGRIQMVLARDGTITFLYATTPGNFVNAGIGLQDATGQRGASYPYSYMQSGQYLKFVPQPGWLTPLTRTGKTDANSLGAARLAINAAGLAVGSYSEPVHISSNGSAEQEASVMVHLEVYDDRMPDVAVRNHFRGLDIEPGDDSPSDDDGTDLGSCTAGDFCSGTFEVVNTGDRDLVLPSASPVSITGDDAGAFSVSSQPSTTLPVGYSSSFYIGFSATKPGVYYATVHIDTGVAGKSPYSFAVTARVLTRDIAIRGNDQPIVHGDGTPVVVNGTDFGAVAWPTEQTFTLVNSGESVVYLPYFTPVVLSGSDMSDFQVTRQPTTWYLLPGESSDFTIRFIATGPGRRSAQVMIHSSVPEKNPYTFMITAAYRQPGIQISGNGLLITSGDDHPLADDGSDFGSMRRGVKSERTFRISNPGTDTLALTDAPAISLKQEQPEAVPAISPTSGFSITRAPASVLAPGASTEFTLSFSGEVLGRWSAAVSIAHNAATGTPFTFTVCAETVNSVPVAESDSFSVQMNRSLEVGLPGVLGNDLDADGDPLTARLARAPEHGKVEFHLNGSFSYIPHSDFTGLDSFAYLPYDGQSNGPVATVFVVTYRAQDPVVAPNPAVPESDTNPFCGAGGIAVVLLGLCGLVGNRSRRRD